VRVTAALNQFDMLDAKEYRYFYRRIIVMNSLTETIAVDGADPRKAKLKQRLLTIGFLTAISVAMVGWLSAFGWAAATVASWLLA